MIASTSPWQNGRVRVRQDDNFSKRSKDFPFVIHWDGKSEGSAYRSMDDQLDELVRVDQAASEPPGSICF